MPSLADIEALRDRQIFFSLSIDVRIRNTCPGCGCRLIDNDYKRAIDFVTGPPKLGRCPKCSWVGTK